MKRCPLLVLALLLGVALSLGAQAAPPAAVQTEVNYLLGMVEMSDCQFYRNGRWYGPKKAQEHLRTKYEYLAGHDRISTTEDFIEMAATKSSLSGKAYAIRCSDGKTVTSKQWLREALTRYRSARKS